MKKLLVIISTFCVITLSNASQINWVVELTSIPDASSTSGFAEDFYFYLMLGDDVAGVSTSIENNSFTTNYTPLDTGRSFLGGMLGDGNASNASWPNGTYDFFLVVFDASKENYLISSVVSGITTTLPTPVNTITFTGGELSGTWKPIPEPATMALVGVGLVALGLRRRRK